MALRVAVLVVCCLLAGVGAASFVVAPETSAPEPAEFDRTVAMGLTLEQQRVLDERVVPRAQIAYSQYPYVVGYRGIGLAADAVDDPLVRQQFGYPQIVYVETAPSAVALDDSGYLVGEQTDNWISASSAYFVIDSDARIPTGPTPVAFAEEAKAAAFVSAHGGSVVSWDARSQFERSGSNGSVARDRIETRQAAATRTVAESAELLDRQVGVVVGEDEPTLQAALASAEPGTVIRLPPGTYEGPVKVNESVTLLGEEATIVGDGNGTVISVRADEVAIAGISITGVGDSLRGEGAPSGPDQPAWDKQTAEAYGYSDAAITADSVDRVLVTDIEVDTPASGIVLRDTEGAVIDDVRINGTDQWRDGFMGVVTIRSPAVVQNSTFSGGRDGVYTHRSDGIVIRNNRFIGGRFGTHFMYTSDAIFTGNCGIEQALSGVIVMTNPTRNVIADNVITDTEQGITTSGSDSYIGGNIVVDTRQGISTSAQNSMYTDNTVLDNEIGFRASAVFPTSVVVRNDVVDNEIHVRATTGPLRVWSRDDEGNYWSGAAALHRRYSPTGPVDGRLHRTEAARTLAAAPIVRGLRVLRGSVPGMRSESVVDAAPRETPAHPEQLETATQLAEGRLDVSGVCGT